MSEPGTRANPIMFFEADSGNGPLFHVCGGLRAVREWLDRQITVGGVTPAARAVVERMLDDVTDDQVAAAAYNGLLPPDWHKQKVAVVANEASRTPEPRR